VLVVWGIPDRRIHLALTIDDLYADVKFDRVRFYLQERGLSNLDFLTCFDFNDLMFVPGLSEETVISAKDIYKQALRNENDEIELESGTLVLDSNSTQQCVYLPIPIASNVESTSNISAQNLHMDQDTPIVEVFAGLPRCGSFIRSCFKFGKTMMSQLSMSDFDSAIEIKGIGAASIEELRKAYISYTGEKLSKPTETILLTDVAIDKAFKDFSNGFVFINYCHKNNIRMISDLKDFSFDETEIKGIGPIGMKKLYETYMSIIGQSSEATSELYIVNTIAPENMKLLISSLWRVGLGLKNTEILAKSGFKYVGDLCDRQLTHDEFSAIQYVTRYLQMSVSDHFIAKVNELNSNSKKCLIDRCKGATLEEIGNSIGITRERVRQILLKTSRSLMKCAEMVADTLVNSNMNSFSYEDLQTFFEYDEMAACCRHVLINSDYLIYFKFSDKFALKSQCPADVLKNLSDFAHDIIGEGLNFYDHLELIEEALPKYGLSFFDFEDIMSYLVQAGYHFFGDYAIRGKQSYANICADAIRKYFHLDIKLDSAEDNEDMLQLRNIINKHYQGLVLPDNNRALTARLASILVLSGRGRYCPIEKVCYSVKLLDELCQFIRDSNQTSFYYSEIFTLFQGRLQLETNILNSNFLHGMLKYLYPNDFVYEKDLLVKNGKERQDINERLSRLISDKGRAMTKTEIKRAIPGINDFVILFTVMRMPEIIQWDYNEFNHINNIKFSVDDYNLVDRLLIKLTEDNKGYTSDSLVFRSILAKSAKFIELNQIGNAQNLFYVIAYFFEEKYIFRRPHIVTKDFPVQELTVVNIARVLLAYKKSFSYALYDELAESLGWVDATKYSVFSDIERDFIRVSYDGYIVKEYFGASKLFLNDVIRQLNHLVDRPGYCSFTNIFDFDNFPECEHKWNGFLLESIIKEYELGYRIIYPQVRDRRYQRGIIVQSTCTYLSFVELVAVLLQKEKVATISETELIKFLRLRGLISSVIPQELYECDRLQYKNEMFLVK
jgi:hypothetical protein